MVAETQFSQDPFTEEERDAILRFLGYPNWANLAQSIQLGYPAASQPLFLVFDSFDRVRPATRARVRQDLCRALETEAQIAESNARLKTSKVGEVTLRGDEFEALLQRLDFWTKRIARSLGVTPNPYADQAGSGMGGGLNVPVVNT